MRAGATPAACGRSRSNRRRAERCDGKDGCSRRARVASSVPVADVGAVAFAARGTVRSEEHTSELQSLMRISYAVFCLKNISVIPLTCFRLQSVKGMYNTLGV